jgi:hypothetical protein
VRCPGAVRCESGEPGAAAEPRDAVAAALRRGGVMGNRDGGWVDRRRAVARGVRRRRGMVDGGWEERIGRADEEWKGEGQGLRPGKGKQELHTREGEQRKGKAAAPHSGSRRVASLRSVSILEGGSRALTGRVGFRARGAAGPTRARRGRRGGIAGGGQVGTR